MLLHIPRWLTVSLQDQGSLHRSPSCHHEDLRRTAHLLWTLPIHIFFSFFTPNFLLDGMTMPPLHVLTFALPNKCSQDSALSSSLKLFLIRSLVTKSKYQAKRLLQFLFFLTYLQCNTADHSMLPFLFFFCSD